MITDADKKAAKRCRAHVASEVTRAGIRHTIINDGIFVRIIAEGMRQRR